MASESSNFYANLSTFCTFCKRNKEPESIYMSHQIKDRDGNVTCPQLFKYRCELCGSTGKEAHTRSYCPIVTNMRRQQPRFSSNPPSTSWSATNIRSSNSISSSSSSIVSSDCSTIDTSPILNVTKSGLFRNMGRVSNSRYNSAGRLRHNRHNHRQDFNNTSYFPRPANNHTLREEELYQSVGRQPEQQQFYDNRFDFNSI